VTIIISCQSQQIEFAAQTYPCRIGRGGFIDQGLGREGDEKTPLGQYLLRFGLYRPDRLSKPPSPLTFRSMRDNDGWCDDPNDPAYNRFVRLPYSGSCETLWRESGVYDIILIMSHNDSPPKAGLGSAVFIHVARPDDKGTLGCIALEPEVMVKLLPNLTPAHVIKIQ